MPDQFWYILAGIVFVAANIILWLHQRRCKAKGITPKPAFKRLKKHEEIISKSLDIFLIAVILLGTLFYGSMLHIFNNDTPLNMPPEYTQNNLQLSLSVDFLLMFIYSVWAVIMASLLSPFHKNITLKKRFILLVMCCVPLVFGILYSIFDNGQNSRFHLKLLITGLLPVLFINAPAILFGKSFMEFIPHLLRKIPLPWFRIPEQGETKPD